MQVNGRVMSRIIQSQWHEMQKIAPNYFTFILVEEYVNKTGDCFTTVFLKRGVEGVIRRVAQSFLSKFDLSILRFNGRFE